MTDPSPPPRSSSWKWWVCILLLLATMVNYMDRLTLNLLGVRIKREFLLDAAQYGQLESAFAYAFALGAIIAGWLADRFNVRWIYPAAVVAWSAAGVLTGMANGFVALLACRFLLGLAEAGNWPCALRTTQHILPPQQRSLGNGILQSGAALGAILTPLIVIGLVRWVEGPRYPDYATYASGNLGHTLARAASGAPLVGVEWGIGAYQLGAWRLPFVVIGVVGFFWAVLWLLSVRSSDLAMTARPRAPSLVAILGLLIALLGFDVLLRIAVGRPEWVPEEWRSGLTSPAFILTGKALVCGIGVFAVFRWLATVTSDETSLPRGLFVRRLFVLTVLVVVINVTWHFFRAWLPLFLQEQRRYTETDTGWFLLLYYLSTDVGSLTAGFVAVLLTSRGWSVHGGRLVVFLVCALLTTLSIAAAFLPAGAMLVGVLLVIGFGSLGLFPIYYSFTQELSARHQGKISGALGCMNWLSMYLLQELVGETVKATGSYEVGVALAGLAPLIGFGVLVALWGRR